MRMLVRYVLALALAICWTAEVQAQTSDARESGDAIATAYASGTSGPAVIKLAALATFALPKDLVFVPAPASNRFLHGLGNGADDSMLGVVIPAGNYTSWYIALSAIETGHVTNGDLARFDLDDIRASLAVATRRGNAARAKLGATPLDAGAFLDQPRHVPAKNRFTTAIRVFESGPSSGGDDMANIDSFVFGRVHAIRVSLVDTLSDYDRHRSIHEAIADAISFVAGQRSIDFVPGRDPLASHVLDVVFGGRTIAEIAAEAAIEAAEAARRAAEPPSQVSYQLKLVLAGILALVSVLAGAFAFTRRERAETPPGRNHVVDRALRTPRR